MKWKPDIQSAISRSDMESILSDAMRVLREIGILCENGKAASLLADHESIFRDGDRLCFAEQAVRDHLETRRVEATPDKGDDQPFTMSGSYAALNYCVPGTGDVRPATSAEVARMIRFEDGRGVRGVVPLIPGDVPAGMVTIAAERIALENSRGLGGSLTVTDREHVRFLGDMNAVVGRPYHLVEQIGISPLRFNGNGLLTALEYADDPTVEVQLDGFIPMAGATCPLDPRSAIVQSTAETLAYDFTCAVSGLVGGNLVIRAEPFDMQYSTIVFGSPEWCLYRALAIEMSGFLMGNTLRSGRFRSVAKRPDAQAMTERTASVLWQSLLGIRNYGGIGQLSVDEVFSPEQAVLDGEIMAYIERLIRGVDLDGGPDDVIELIREGVEQGTFVGVDDTVDHFREFFWFPEMFRHWSLGRWRDEGSPAIIAEAWARAQEDIARSTHELADEQRAEIAVIYKEAEKYTRNA